MIAGKPVGWAEDIINAWDRILRQREPEEDELEHPILRVFRENHAQEIGWNQDQVVFRGQSGRLVYGECSELLAALQKLNIRELNLPRSEQALGRRIRSGKYIKFKVLDEDSAPELPMLKRKALERPIGLFFADDSMTVVPRPHIPAVIPEVSVN